MLRRTLLVHLTVALALGCGGGGTSDAAIEDAPSDAATDATSSPDGGSCPPLTPFLAGDAQGHADPLGAGAGQARAGRLSESQLPIDRMGLATWEAGDYVLANDRVALLIESAGQSDLYDPYGGRPVGVARVEAGRLADAGDLNEILFGFGPFLVATESVTVLNDGSDGNAAVVRAIGPLAPIDFAGDLLAAVATSDFSGLPAAVDYSLEPGSDTVGVTLHLQQPAQRRARAQMLLGIFQYYRMPFFVPGVGFTAPQGSLQAAAFIDDEGASYAWLPPDGSELSVLIEVSGVVIFTMPRATVEACSQGAIPLGRIALGGNGLPGLQAALAREEGRTLRTITGTVREAGGGAPAERSVRVHAVRADGSHFARIWPAADGSFSLEVPEEDVQLFAFRRGLPVVGPVAVPAASPSATIDLPGQAILRVSVSDRGTSDPLPARVQVLPAAGEPGVPDTFGERGIGGRGRAHVAFTTSGTVDLPVAPGEHTVIVSRGYEYELVSQTLAVAAGEVRALDVELDHVVDTTGVMCADYHIHTFRSPDSPDPGELKIAGLIADGVELPIRSDHQWVNDFQPEIEAMGLSRFAHGIGGLELTTFAWGHFGVFPLVEDESVNGSAPDWVGRLPPAVFAEVRARPEDPALIINHPRSGGTLGGYFTAAGFNRTTGEVSSPEHWDDAFSLVEVFNDDDLEDQRDTLVADWLTLLRTRRVFAVGSSDSHNIYGSPVGYPRTCLRLGADDPQAVTAAQVRDVTEAGRSVISGGIYLDVAGPGGAGPGEEAAGVGDTASFNVTVQAASWIEVDRLEVIADGESVETIPITEGDRDPLEPHVRIRAAVSVPVATSGSYVIFHAAGPSDLAPVHPGRRPFAVSNPVFLSR
ncbi:MAG: CehA/McbA family metallohydrolase [Sandaracinaceae bacterium]|nr:CehA/McbA family metallohydrolase [Sandaracinaceae bacterium]